MTLQGMKSAAYDAENSFFMFYPTFSFLAEERMLLDRLQWRSLHVLYCQLMERAEQFSIKDFQA